jgi:hypothetical protein
VTRSLLSLLLIASLSTGCATAHGPRAIDDLPPGTQTIYDWARVRQLDASAEIAVSTRRARAAERTFLGVDDTRIVVLNLRSPALSPASGRALRAMAAQHPDVLLAVPASGALVQDEVRVSREGVFVANRKVAEFGEVVETIARDDVIEIDGPVVARGSVAAATLGGWLGFGVGVVPALGGAGAAVAWPILIGTIVLGAYLGHHWSSHTTDGIVYKAR